MQRATALRSIWRTTAQAGQSKTTHPLRQAQWFHRQTPAILRKQPPALGRSWTADHLRRRQSTDEKPPAGPREEEAQSPTGERPLTDRQAEEQQDGQVADAIAARKAISPAYQLWFTCKTCLTRSGHTISKQAYHFGTCVIQCPTCKTQHLISDNLKIFRDQNTTLEEIAKEHGELLKRGRLGVNGDIEFYRDDQPSDEGTSKS